MNALEYEYGRLIEFRTNRHTLPPLCWFDIITVGDKQFMTLGHCDRNSTLLSAYKNAKNRIQVQIQDESFFHSSQMKNELSCVFIMNSAMCENLRPHDSLAFFLSLTSPSPENMRKVKRILIYFLLASALFISGGVITVVVYEQEVVAYALERIQSQLKSKMTIGEVGLSVFRKFPRASLEINGIWIEDGLVPGDTLLHAEKAYLAFNLLDLYRGNYTINEVDLRRGSLRIVQEGGGRDNFHFWKSSGDSGSFRFDISALTLSEMDFLYAHRNSDIAIAGYTSELNLAGTFNSESFQLDASGELRTDSIHVGNLRGAKDQFFALESRISGRNDGSLVSINETLLTLDEAELSWDGDILQTEGLSRISARVGVKGLTTAEFKSVFPAAWPAALKDYATEGRINAEGRIEGFAGSGKQPRITGLADVKKGRITHKSSGESVSQIESSIEFALEENGFWHLTFNPSTASFRSGEFGFNGKLSDTGTPFADLSLEGELELADVRSFFNLSNIEIMEGDALVNASVKGHLPDWIIGAESMADLSIEGKVELSSGRLKLTGNQHSLENIEGKFLLNGQDAAIQEMACRVAGSDYELDGFFRNLMPYLIDENQALTIDARLYSKQVDLDALLENETKSSEESYQLIVPQRVVCNLSIALDELSFRKFSATEISGVVHLENGELSAKPVSLHTSEGTFLAEMNLRQTAGSDYRLDCVASVRKVNVQKLFTSFGNFGQEFITDRHLRGKVDADVRFNAALTRQLTMDSRKVNGLIDVTIQNGELIGLEALESISDYLRANKLISSFVEADDFDRKIRHVQFSTLHNQVEIRNGEIRFPTMDIRSSAMDISASGSHSFSNHIDYSITFRIRDLLKKKSSEFGEEEDDGLGSRFYLSMTGTTANPKFAFDRDAAKAQRKDDMEKEKGQFKAILKEEFGLFKNDDSVPQVEPKQDQPKTKVTVDWGDDEVKPETGKEKTPEKVQEEEKKKKKSWLDKLGGNEEEETVPIPTDDDDF